MKEPEGRRCHGPENSSRTLCFSCLTISACLYETQYAILCHARVKNLTVLSAVTVQKLKGVRTAHEPELLRFPFITINNERPDETPMNQKELNELRRRWKPEKNAVSRIYGCFVNSSREIVADLDEPLGIIPQEEAEKYLSLLKKALSGTLGKNLIDIVFSTQQIMEEDEHKLLMKLRSSGLKDDQVRQTFYQKVIQSLDMGGSGYLLLLANDTYDIPHRSKDDTPQVDASDEVFSYIVCAVCPVKAGKPELGYFSGDNEFHCAASQIVSAPELGFLFPAFDDRRANIYNALFYSRKAGELHQEFIDAVFHTDLPMSAAEQREAFEAALSEALGGSCSLEIVQAVHEQLAARIEAHQEEKDPEPLAVSPDEVSKVLLNCGVSEEQAEVFQTVCGKRFGTGAVLNPVNLIDTKKVELRMEKISLSIASEYIHLVGAKVIDGRKVLIIPVEDHLEFNGLAVDVNTDKE